MLREAVLLQKVLGAGAQRPAHAGGAERRLARAVVLQLGCGLVLVFDGGCAVGAPGLRRRRRLALLAPPQLLVETLQVLQVLQALRVRAQLSQQRRQAAVARTLEGGRQRMEGTPNYARDNALGDSLAPAIWHRTRRQQRRESPERRAASGKRRA